ncbi:hypothetical protein M433DRAFT_396728 [Acidomyces richmondensis BFW]|nr:MAG: hypothetical protein FE78DRAFT_490847 [Acidomyces sp. 'richmondensis']KYG42683.1 hypothetical protein M433DRAFT_396728 [Acidomyces richmondensis BFW]
MMQVATSPAPILCGLVFALVVLVTLYHPSKRNFSGGHVSGGRWVGSDVSSHRPNDHSIIFRAVLHEVAAAVRVFLFGGVWVGLKARAGFFQMPNLLRRSRAGHLFDQISLFGKTKTLASKILASSKYFQPAAIVSYPKGCDRSALAPRSTLAPTLQRIAAITRPFFP